MPLTLRECFRLKISLAQKYQQPDAAKQVATVAGIKTRGISLFGMSALDFWENILTEAEKGGHLVSLLKVVATQHPDDPEY
ncbi:MAG: hypothetical protein H7Z72_07300, partial [Bacteroidetes bacterium]|nr:hypothetical protein [Fibrella sp.]